MPVTFEVANVTPKLVEGSTDNFKYTDIGQYKRLAKGKVLQSSISNESRSYGDSCFINLVIRAYNQHHKLELRPDDIWMAIATQFAVYVEANSEELRSKFVDFDGKKELEVFISGTLYNAPYDLFVHLMSEKIEENIKDPEIKDWILPNFTTTTDKDRIAAGIVLMSSLQNYFDYKCSLCCGIPEITLLGEKEDWQKVYAKAHRLLKFDNSKGYMKTWWNMLMPILSKFIDVFNGDIDKVWWNRICCYHSGGSGDPCVSGWITAFSIFAEHGKWNGDCKYNSWRRIDAGEWLVLETGELAPSYVSAPVKIVELDGTEYKSRVFGGHMTYQSDSFTIKPQVDWFISLVDEKVLAVKEDDWY